MEKKELIGLSKEELTAELVNIGEKAFRAKQLWQWIYFRGETDFDKMTNISKDLREKLKQHFSISRPKIITEQISTDKTHKWLLEFSDGQRIETVYIPEEDRDYYLERRYPAFGNLVPRDVASRAAKERCDAGFGVNNTGLAVFLDFSEAISRLGIDIVLQRYGNLFDMYEEITDVNPGELAKEIAGVKYYNPMMIYPAIHYTMGGIWVDYELMTSIKGLYAIGEANFSDHGANRLGASALMQGLADGYFVLPYTIQNYLSDQIQVPRFSTDLPEFVAAEKAVNDKIQRLMNIKGHRSVDSIHKELGHIMWDFVGMGRTKESLTTALAKLKEVRKTFWSDLRIPGEANELNVELEKAIRLADFIEIGELMAYDALNREESCGGHFREEHQTPEGEALRHDDKFSYVACWKYTGEGKEPELIKEDLNYQFVKVQTRNYKS